MNAAENASEPRLDREALGARLAHAREARGMSARQAANVLKLSINYVEALEAGAYEKLPGTTYVRGYLRSYARLLGMPERDVLEAHARATVATSSPAPSPRPPARKRELKSGDRPIRLVSWAIVVGLVALLVAWWQAREENPAPVTASAPEAVAPVTRSEPPAAVEPAINGLEPAQPEVQAGMQPDVQPDAQAATATPGPEPVSPPQTALDTEPAPVPAAGGEEGVAAPAPPTPAAPPGIPAGEVGVVLRFRADCWTDVRDATGERLVYRTVTAGSEVRVHGKPPLRLFLGNAQAVDVEFDGQAYDFSSHVRGVFARFTLPAGVAGATDSR